MKKISSKHMILLLFALCWMVYFTSYLGRLNYSAAMAQLLQEGVLQKSQGGLISTLFFVCYACGQLINGFLGDKLRPQTMLVTGVGLSALMNLLMGLQLPFGVMAVAWAVNGYAQSMIWPPIVYLFTSMLHTKTMIKCFTNIASTIAGGTLFSYFLSAMLLKTGSWSGVFLVPALLLAVVGIVFFLLFPKVERHRAQLGEEVAPVTVQPPSPTEKAPLKSIFLSPFMLLLLLPVFVHGVIKDGLTVWIPTYISESFGAGAVTAILVSMVLPVVNLGGAYLAGFARLRLRGDDRRCTAVFFAAACMCLGVLWLFGGGSLWLSLGLLALSSCCMMAANTAFISYIPVLYAKSGRSASVSGFLNATAYVGAAVSSVSIGLLAEGMGWSAAIGSFVLLTALALVVSLVPQRKQA